jgi:signal transduction histidine kinase/ligand-binding sensor domain-containing protein/DNA-binding response OmpR family regulator
MRNVFWNLLLLFLLWGTNILPLHAQQTIRFDRITTDDGLSQSDINCIYQDVQGFMWFGTHDGLNKYDGYTFTVYKPDLNVPGSITSNLIYDITGDEEGNLWIGTTGNGLSYFDRKTETFTQFKNRKDDPTSLGNNHVTAVYLDKKDRLWVGTNDGLNMLDLRKPKEQWRFKSFNTGTQPFKTGWHGNATLSIYEDSKQQLWVGGHNGLYNLARDENGDIYFRLVNETIGLPRINVHSIGEDQRGNLLLGSSNGFYAQQKGDSLKVKMIEKGSFFDFKIDDKGTIWAGTDNGLYHFRNTPSDELPKLVEAYSNDPQDVHSLSKNIVKSVYLDRTGIVWAGTNGGGLNKFDPERKHFRHIRKTGDEGSLSYDKIRAMFEDSNGDLWIGTEGGGLNRLPSKNGKDDYSGFEHFGGVSKIFALSEMGSGDHKTLLIGAENNPGLFKLDITHPDKIDSSKITPVSDIERSVFSLLTDSRQNLWIGTYSGGVHRWNTKTDSDTFEKSVFANNPDNPSSISSNIIRNIYEDRKGNIWFATGNGLCMLSKSETRKENPKFRVFKNDPEDPHSLSHNYILSLFEDSSGTLWVGTFGGGLNQFVPTYGRGRHQFVPYTEEDGLPNNVIKGILEDGDHNLWLSTNRGLSRFDIEKEKFTNYDTDDGLQSSEFQELACLKRENGEILFGGINGFNAFYPDTIEENTIEPETVVTHFTISNRPVAIGGEINGRKILNGNINYIKELELKYRENSFGFEFAALHYAAPRKNQFAYMLEGFDEDWIHTAFTKRFATYTNIEPGDYTFKVKASNNDGIWDSTPSEIHLTVTPPFWRTGLAYFFYGALVLGLLWLFWRYTFIRTTEKHQLELEHLEKEKSEEIHRMKLEFFTNISHEFRTPLTLIKGPLEYLQKKGDTLNQEKVREQYGLMHKNADYLMRLVNQLLDFRKIGQDKMRLVVRHSNITEFIREVGEPFQFMAHRQSIDFEVISEDKGLLTWFDHDALEKITNNLVSNAFKFTPKRGKIAVEIRGGKAYRGTDLPQLPLGISEYVVIQVRDSGSGIPEDSIEHIFERFYVEKDRNQKNLNGAGIGLSFVKNLVELHQGRIAVFSESGVTTYFTIALPMHREAYEDKEAITIKELSDGDFRIRSSEAESFAIGLNDEIVDNSLSNDRSKSPVVLVVDDNPDIRSFIGATLEGEYTVHEAENGLQGLEMALTLIPNIILTDVVMPVMDGIELCQKVKTKTATSHIPVLMITAKSSQESELQGLQNGADDYIRKPFDIELLQVKLTNIMRQRDQLRKRFNREINLRPKEVTVTSTDERFLQQAIEIVQKHMMNTDFNVEMLVKEMGHSRSNLYLKFKEITGLSSSEFIRNIRLKRAVQLFDQSDLSVKEIMYRTGFNTASYFSKCFKKQFGVVPSEYVARMQKKKKTHQF